MTPNPDHLDAMMRSVEEAPYPNLLGMRLTKLDFDYAEVCLTLDQRHMQPYGIAHGGVWATLLDTATFWAAYVRVPDGDGMVNVDLKLNYLEARSEGRVIAEGRCLRPGRKVSYAEASVRDEAGKLLAHGTSTLLTLPGKGLSGLPPKFIEG